MESYRLTCNSGMDKKIIFIDDSGDPGFKSDSSDNFVIAAALFMNPEIAESVMWTINDFRNLLGWKYNHEFKFSKNPKKVVKELLQKVVEYDFQVYAVYIEKNDFHEISSSLIQFFNREKLYNWTIKELLKDIPMETAKITIDGRSNKSERNITCTYLRRELNGDRSKNLKITIQDSVRTDLLQLADLIAGSINRSLQLNKTDCKDYISIFEDKIVGIRKITFR